jgi:hypothetical protein
MGWRREVENLAEVICQFCGKCWLDWGSRARRQKYGACHACALKRRCQPGANKARAQQEIEHWTALVEAAKAAIRKWGDPAERRVDSSHTEIVRGGEAVCAICGLIAGTRPDPRFHADHYVDLSDYTPLTQIADAAKAD